MIDRPTLFTRIVGPANTTALFRFVFEPFNRQVSAPKLPTQSLTAQPRFIHLLKLLAFQAASLNRIRVSMAAALSMTDWRMKPLQVNIWPNLVLAVETRVRLFLSFIPNTISIVMPKAFATSSCFIGALVTSNPVSVGTLSAQRHSSEAGASLNWSYFALRASPTVSIYKQRSRHVQIIDREGK